jgi:hypothetical protein
MSNHAKSVYGYYKNDPSALGNMEWPSLADHTKKLKSGWVEEWVNLWFCGGKVEEWGKCLGELKSERGAWRVFLCCDFFEVGFVWCADELDFGFFR